MSAPDYVKVVLGLTPFILCVIAIYAIGRIALDGFLDDLKRDRSSLNNATECVQCGFWIVRRDDEARICVQCGGRNRRAERSQR